MITRNHHGLAWRVISPSFYELVSHPCVDISFVGDQWMLHVPRDDGSPILEMFSSLDEAARIVSLGVLGGTR